MSSQKYYVKSSELLLEKSIFPRTRTGQNFLFCR